MNMLACFIRRLLDRTYPLFSRLMPYQVFAYLAVGAANTALNIGLFIVLYLALAPGPLAVEWATALSFGVTVLTGFWLSKRLAFTAAANGKKETGRQLGRYLLVSLQGQCSDYLITKGLIVLWAVQPVVAYLVATAVMLTINYFLQKYYTFGKKRLANG